MKEVDLKSIDKVENLAIRGISPENAFITASYSSGSGSGIPFGPGTHCSKMLKNTPFTFMPDYEHMEINCPQETRLLYLKFDTTWGDGEIRVTNYINTYKTDYNGYLTIPIAENEPKFFWVYRTNRQATINGYAACYACNSGSGSGSGF
ncbi:MAG: hypothetical protein LBV43_11110 [Prevotella sp.]|jgi:hypothetical protein|nr:hypothetical protein [Prevotella sp.]